MADTTPTTTGAATEQPTTGDKIIADKVLMYACVFTYEKAKVRNAINNFNYSNQCKLTHLADLR